MAFKTERERVDPGGRTYAAFSVLPMYNRLPLSDNTRKKWGEG